VSPFPFIADKLHPERIRPPAPPAVFGLPVRTLSIASHWRTPATGALLAAEIGRRPANLHLHIQRISLWRSLGDERRAAAAVVDLWIVLGPRGIDLRTRMLRNHYAALEERELGMYLSQHLNGGINRHDPRIAFPDVVLARPVEGERCFLTNTSSPRSLR
jgi:hypothetical protein